MDAMVATGCVASLVAGRRDDSAHVVNMCFAALDHMLFDNKTVLDALVAAGCVPLLGALLQHPPSGEAADNALGILENLLKTGRRTVCDAISKVISQTMLHSMATRKTLL